MLYARRSIVTILLLGASVALGLSACADGEAGDQMELPTTPVLSFRAGWAVVDTTYARILEQPDPGSDILGHERRGTVLEILSKTNYTERVDDETDFWYQVRSEDFSGWVFGTAVELYTSRERARNASRVLRDE
jgi:hypothetical protein